MKTIEDFRELYNSRVRRGIAFLDQHPEAPPDWRAKVKNLRMDCDDKCTLGRIFDTYVKGTTILRLGFEARTELGFSLHGDLQTPRDENWLTYWQLLGQCWETLIKEEN